MRFDHHDLDPERLERRLRHRVNQKISQTIWGFWFSIIFGLVMIALFAGAGWYIYSVTKDAIADHERTVKDTNNKSSKKKDDSYDKGRWDGEGPFVCKGNDAVELKKMKVELDEGPAISAEANCRLKLVDVEIVAPLVLRAAGNARVEIDGGRLEGTDGVAVEAASNAEVRGVGVEIVGKTTKKGRASIDLE